MSQIHVMFDKQARVFPFSPNWVSPFIETLEWKTDVLKSHNGSEHRRALRESPRRGFEYEIMLRGTQAQSFESLLWRWQNRDFAVPVWTDVAKLTSVATAGVTSLPLTTSGVGFRAGDFAIIYLNADLFEVVEVSSVTSGSIETVLPVTATWFTGTRVMPLVLAHLATSVAETRHTGSVLSAGLTFSTSPESTYSGIVASTPVTLYDGIEVITHKPNWSSAIQNTFTRDFNIADAGVGPIGYFQTEATSRIVRPFTWFLKTRQAIAEFKSLMGRLRGQVKTVWVPSWYDDFTLAPSHTFDQTKLTVAGIEFYSTVGVDVSRDRLAITMPSGVTVYRRILSMAPDYVNNATILQLDSTLATTFSVTDNVRLQLLLRCRLASDKVVIPWLTDSVSAPITNFTTVKL